MIGKKIAVLSWSAVLLIGGWIPTTLTVAGGAAMIGCSGKSDTRTDARTEARTDARAEERVEDRND